MCFKSRLAIQNPPSERACGFDSRPRHQSKERPIPSLDSPVSKIVLSSVVVGLFFWGFLGPRKSVVDPASGLAASESAGLVASVREHLANEEWEAALEVASALDQAYPENHNYVRYRANALGGLGRFEEEAEAWESFLLIAPRPITGCPDIGLAYRAAGSPDRSLDAFERCLDLNPDNSDSIFFLALAVERSRDLDRAESLYTRGLARSPGYSDMAIGLARIHLARGNTQEALRTSASVFEEAPGHPDARLVYARALRAEGELARAREILLEGVARRSSYRGFYRQLARIALEQGRSDEAAEYNRQAEEAR